MKECQTPPFIRAFFALHEELRQLPVLEHSGEGWHGAAITLPSRAGSDVMGGLDIEEVDNEIRISFDYAHAHLEWPPHPQGSGARFWWDASALVEAILTEKVVASSGWIAGELRVGSLHEADSLPDLLVPALQHRRVRSWLGTFDKDEALLG